MFLSHPAELCILRDTDDAESEGFIADQMCEHFQRVQTLSLWDQVPSTSNNNHGHIVRGALNRKVTHEASRSAAAVAVVLTPNALFGLQIYRIAQKLPQVLECACSRAVQIKLPVVKEDANAVAATPKRRVQMISGHHFVRRQSIRDRVGANRPQLGAYSQGLLQSPAVHVDLDAVIWPVVAEAPNVIIIQIATGSVYVGENLVAHLLRLLPRRLGHQLLANLELSINVRALVFVYE